MLSKTFGRDMNMRPGPEADKPSLPMKVNTAGIINRPARKETKVSKNSMRFTEATASALSLT